MTDKASPPPTQVAVPSQPVPVAPPGPTVKDEIVQKAETGEEEPYTIKCICNFSDDDGNTIYCETCDTWQHIDCFYPNNRDEAIREDFAHSCADCKPRPLDRQRAIERTTRLRTIVLGDNAIDKKTKRPQSRSHKKKPPKPNDVQVNGQPTATENGKLGNLSDPPPPSKKPKSSHRPSQSVSSAAPKRSPSYGTSKPNASHPLSPATTPPDLPDDFKIHHYSEGFCSLYNEHDVPDTHNNAFASLAIPTALSTWLREPQTMKEEVGRTHSDVFQDEPATIEQKKPKLEVKDATRPLNPTTTLRWRFVKSTTAIDKDVPLIELNGEIGFQKDYCADLENVWGDLSSPLPFVFFHPDLPLYIDTRKEGSLARYVRRSCKPNAQLDTYLSGGSEYHFWLVSDRYISENEQITLPWDFRLEKSVRARWLNLLGLREDDAATQDEAEMDELEYTAISNWIDRILSEYGGCACDLDNNCAFARFHRRYLFGKNQARSSAGKKKPRKPRTHAISPTSTGQATNSRAASEGHVDDKLDNDTRYESASSRSKPASRDVTPVRQGSLDRLGILTEPTDRDKRKVAMVEDSFRRMEQSHPPKKKKRTSDGTATSTSSRHKGRNGSIVSHGHYVDSGTSRSKSGSPSSVQSPNLSNPFKSAMSRHDSLSRSRQASASPRPEYCDACVQTDPVEGEWFSEPAKSPRPKKRIISLSKRLLSNRQKILADGTRRSQPPPSPNPMSTAMEIDSPEQKPVVPVSAPKELLSPTSQAGDIPMVDAPSGPSGASTNASETKFSKPKTPDLRVLMPPVPAFDNSGLGISSATTPQSASSSITQSPIALSNGANPFAPPAVNGVAAHPAHPSPAKKKLSLSDYTKSRMNKAAGKVSGGSALLKPSLSSPEDLKVDITMESHPMDKTEDAIHQSATTPATNGIS